MIINTFLHHNQPMSFIISKRGRHILYPKWYKFNNNFLLNNGVPIWWLWLATSLTWPAGIPVIPVSLRFSPYRGPSYTNCSPTLNPYIFMFLPFPVLLNCKYYLFITFYWPYEGPFVVRPDNVTLMCVHKHICIYSQHGIDLFYCIQFLTRGERTIIYNLHNNNIQLYI